MLNKRILALLLIFAMMVSLVLSLNVNAEAATINDMDKSSAYAKSAIAYLAEQGVVKGDQNGNYNPQKYVTRAEMVALLARVFKLDTTTNVSVATFADVPVGNWANPYVEAAFKAGIVTGMSPTEFKPNAQITREQMAVMFVRALKLIDTNAAMELKNLKDFSDGSKVSVWAQKEVETALEAQLMNGMTSQLFEPKKNAKKEMAAVVVERLMKNKESIIAAFQAPERAENDVKLLINGEEVLLKNATLVKEGHAYLPMEFFNSYTWAWGQKESTAVSSVHNIILDEAYQKDGLKNIWIQENNKNAYKNTDVEPFTTSNEGAASQVTLSQAPFGENNVTYVPVEDILPQLGIEFNYNEAGKTLTLSHPNIGESANLYRALKKVVYGNYLGEIRAKGTTDYTEKNNNYHIKDSFDMRDRMPDVNHGEFYTRYTFQENNKAPEYGEDHVIVSYDKYYTKDPSDNLWEKKIIKPYEGRIMLNLYNPVYENNEITLRDMNGTLLYYMDKLDIKNAGVVSISGVYATKYVVNLDLNTLKNTMTDEEYAVIKEIFEPELRGAFKFTYEFYVTGNQMLKQGYSFYGEFKDVDTGAPIDINSFAEIYYNKIPRDFKVVEPAASLVKATVN